MKKLALTLLFMMLAAPAFAASMMPQSFADEVDRLSPAVVNVSTTQKVKTMPMQEQQLMFPPGSPFEQFNEMFNQRGAGRMKGGKPVEKEATSLGSGFVIDAKGIVVTNNHVVADADEIHVILQDNTKLNAEVIGRDTKIDLAVLRVKPEKPLAVVEFGDSDKVRVGDWVIAIGNPYGLGGTVTAGIISARARDINVGTFDDFLQTDAAINRGNSGGPMFDTDGKVIGINTAIFSPSGGSVGIGFAIPSALAEPAIRQIIEFGEVKRAWLGVQIQPVTDEVANALGLKKANGALVLGVVAGGPAAVAGVLEGDVILKFDGKDVTDMKKLPRYVADSPIGERKTMQVYRNGKIKNLVVDLQKLKEDDEAKLEEDKSTKEKPIELAPPVMGMQFVPVTKPTSGLEVVKIDPASEAFDKGVREGNLLVKAGNIALRKPSDLKRAIDLAVAEDKKFVLVLVSNGEEARFLPLTIK